jgi:hypothetical protein
MARREEGAQRGEAAAQPTPLREARTEKEGFEPSKEEISPLTP